MFGTTALNRSCSLYIKHLKWLLFNQLQQQIAVYTLIYHYYQYNNSIYYIQLTEVLLFLKFDPHFADFSGMLSDGFLIVIKNFHSNILIYFYCLTSTTGLQPRSFPALEIWIGLCYVDNLNALSSSVCPGVQGPARHERSAGGKSVPGPWDC